MLSAVILTVLGATTPAPIPIVAPGPVVAAGGSQTRTLADVARERKLGVRPSGSGTFSVTGASGMPELVLSLSEPSEAVIAAPPHGVSASEAATGWYVYGSGGTRTFYYYSHAPSHQHSAAHAHAPVASGTHATAGRSTSSAGHSSRKH